MTDTEILRARVNRLCDLADQGNPFARYLLSELDLRVKMGVSLAGDIAAVGMEIMAPSDGKVPEKTS